MANIGVFGGSFDPVHLEHVEIIKQVLNEFSLDKIIVVPAYLPPHKKSLNVSSIDRLNMLKLAISNLTNVEIDTCELDKKEVVYTYQTLDYLQNKHLGDKLKFIIGADSFDDLSKWKQPEYIGEKYGYIVVCRNQNFINKHSPYFKYIKVSNFVGKISSTQVRIKLKNNCLSENLIDNKVLEYIKLHKLYETK